MVESGDAYDDNAEMEENSLQQIERETFSSFWKRNGNSVLFVLLFVFSYPVTVGCLSIACNTFFSGGLQSYIMFGISVRDSNHFHTHYKNATNCTIQERIVLVRDHNCRKYGKCFSISFNVTYVPNIFNDNVDECKSKGNGVMINEIQKKMWGIYMYNDDIEFKGQESIDKEIKKLESSHPELTMGNILDQCWYFKDQVAISEIEVMWYLLSIAIILTIISLCFFTCSTLCCSLCLLKTYQYHKKYKQMRESSLMTISESKIPSQQETTKLTNDFN